MAVAPHVSRVSKSYSPYGYSVVEEFMATVTSKTGALDEPEFLTQLMVSEDIYIEEIRYVGIDAVAANNTNYLTISVMSFPSGAATQIIHGGTDTRAANNGAIVADTFYNINVTTPVVTGNPVRGLAIALTRSANDASVNSKSVDIYVKYRRKA